MARTDAPLRNMSIPLMQVVKLMGIDHVGFGTDLILAASGRDFGGA